MRKGKSNELRFVNRILIRNLETEFTFSLQKSQRSGEWEVAWNDNSWPANDFAIERFYGELNEWLRKRKVGDDLSRCHYEVTIFSKNVPKNIKLNAEEARILSFDMDRQSPLKVSEDVALIGFFSPQIFSHVRDDCKIFKIKSSDGEFVFAKRNGKWFLDDLTAHLEVKSDLVATFFREIFTLEGKDVCHSYDEPGKCDLSVTLYGGNVSERVDFFSGEGDLFFVENAAIDMFFFIGHEKYSKITEIAKSLLKFQIFHTLKCEDVNVVLIASDEHFNFHDLRNQNMWQFTYSKKGELKVQEISKEHITSILEMLDKVESIGIAQDLYEENKQFTITLNEGTDNSKVFSFYESDGKMFVGVDGQNTQFEIESSFSPMFFHILRSHISKSEDT